MRLPVGSRLDLGALAQAGLPLALELVDGSGGVLGHVELQVGMGPVLSSQDAQVGVASAIAGRTRARLELIGRAGQSGTVPMGLRRDPLVVAAHVVQRVDTIARATDGVLATVGELVVEPGDADVVPVRVTLGIDVRAADDEDRLQVWATIADRIGRLVQEGGVESRALALEHSPSVACDPRLGALLAAAARARGVAAPALLGDAVTAPDLAPLAVLLVRSDEQRDVAVALGVLEEFVRALALAEAAR